MHNDVIEQIKQRVSLVDVVRAKAPSMKRKGRDWWACCPFHQEKTPSFSVNEEKGFYHCFGCGLHGDIFSFVQEQEGLNFPETLKKLADMAGVQLPEEPMQQQRQDEKAKFYAAMAAAQGMFQGQYKHSSAAAYVEKRGLSPEAIAHFGLGYALDSWENLNTNLQGQGFKPDTLREVGLTKPGKQGRGDYDAFRNRLMFPIYDMQDRVVAFGGRVLSKDDEPKYLNSPESPVFYKGRQLYNLNGARTAIRETGEALVVEGYTDVIALWEHGYKHAVAPLGTAITPEQVETLWKHCQLPTICLDGDKAGQRAAARVAERVLPILKPGYSLKFVWMPQGSDPDTLLRSKGAGGLEKVLSGAQSLEDVLWQGAQQAGEMNTGVGRAAVEQAIQDIVKQIKHADVAKHVRQVLKDQLWRATRQNGKKQRFSNKKQDIPEVTGVPLERLLLISACHHIEVARQYEEEIAELAFHTGPELTVQKKLCEFLVAGLADDAWPPYLEDSGTEQLLAELSAATLIDQIITPATEVAEWWANTYRQYRVRRQGPAQRVAALAAFKANPSKENLELLKQVQRRKS